MGNKISKFAPKDGFPNLPVIDGIKLSACNANISKEEKFDLLLIQAAPSSVISGLLVSRTPGQTIPVTYPSTVLANRLQVRSQ